MFNITNDSTAKTILDLAGADVDSFLALDAKSNEQKDYANNVKINTLSEVWSVIREDWKTSQFAQAVLYAFSQHTEAHWWIDNKMKLSFGRSAMSFFSQDIKKFLDGEVK